jgi:hypothetical protein
MFNIVKIISLFLCCISLSVGSFRKREFGSSSACASFFARAECGIAIRKTPAGVFYNPASLARIKENVINWTHLGEGSLWGTKRYVDIFSSVFTPWQGYVVGVGWIKSPSGNAFFLSACGKQVDKLLLGGRIGWSEQRKRSGFNTCFGVTYLLDERVSLGFTAETFKISAPTRPASFRVGLSYWDGKNWLFLIDYDEFENLIFGCEHQIAPSVRLLGGWAPLMGRRTLGVEFEKWNLKITLGGDIFKSIFAFSLKSNF